MVPSVSVLTGFNCSLGSVTKLKQVQTTNVVQKYHLTLRKYMNFTFATYDKLCAGQS